MKRFLIALLLASGCASSVAGDLRPYKFAPDACEFAVTFPVEPMVEKRQGSVRALTPTDRLPWLIAQCFPTSSTAHMTVEYREQEHRDQLAKFNVLRSSTTSESTPVGEETTTSAVMLVGDQQVMFHRITVVGSHSFMFLVVTEPADGSEQEKRRTFFSSLRRADE